jgi:hypothetical protein
MKWLPGSAIHALSDILAAAIRKRVRPVVVHWSGVDWAPQHVTYLVEERAGKSAARIHTRVAHNDLASANCKRPEGVGAGRYCSPHRDAANPRLGVVASELYVAPRTAPLQHLYKAGPMKAALVPRVIDQLASFIPSSREFRLLAGSATTAEGDQAGWVNPVLHVIENEPVNVRFAQDCRLAGCSATVARQIVLAINPTGRLLCYWSGASLRSTLHSFSQLKPRLANCIAAQEASG